MTKTEVLKAVKRRGVRGMLAAKRIEQSAEFRAMADDVEIAPATLQGWIDDGAGLGLHVQAHLSETDIKLIGRVVEGKKGKDA